VPQPVLQIAQLLLCAAAIQSQGLEQQLFVGLSIFGHQQKWLSHRKNRLVQLHMHRHYISCHMMSLINGEPKPKGLGWGEKRN
jgi:hypothetical protein